jgi:hypothetical protein
VKFRRVILSVYLRFRLYIFVARCVASILLASYRRSDEMIILYPRLHSRNKRTYKAHCMVKWLSSSIYLLCIRTVVQHDLQTVTRYKYSQLSPAFRLALKHSLYQAHRLSLESVRARNRQSESQTSRQISKTIASQCCCLQQKLCRQEKNCNVDNIKSHFVLVRTSSERKKHSMYRYRLY